MPLIGNRIILVTRLGWDMDPFVVVSFGKKVFRTRVIRHSLNPTWDEKLWFHIGTSRETVDSFLTRHGKPIDGELSFDEVVMCLEQELVHPRSEKKRISDDNAPHFDSCASVTPGFLPRGFSLPPVLDRLNFPGPLLQQVPHLGGGESSSSDSIQAPVHFSEPPQQPLSELVPPSFTTSSSSSTTGLGPGVTGGSLATSDTHQSSVSSSEAEDSSGKSDDVVEHVINIENCPLCHRHRLKSRAEADIPGTAQMVHQSHYEGVKWRVPAGSENSVKIIVQNRMTGQLEEEKMQVYVRLGIRLLYKGATSRMEGHRGTPRCSRLILV
ncbi:hypothetical protein JB92DRAFT_3126437 [Gautieria morchelliformis]|nr:hypothetical protein JB92DRAFT_3126437 [Gautieria morchelliformis]